MWMFSGTFAIPSLLATLVIDEIIEYGISNLLSKTGIKAKVTKLDKVIGLIPIPLITSITIRCSIELFKSFKEDNRPKKLY